MGTTNAASTAACLRLSFPGMKLALLIGVCGGVPAINGCDVFLGDVIISRTLVQYHYGRQYPGHFAVKKTIDDSLGRANKDIRGLLASIESEFGRRRLEIKAKEHLNSLQGAAIRERRQAKYSYPGITQDKLYLPEYRHLHYSSCDICCDGSANACELATRGSCEDLGCNDAYLAKRKRLDAGSTHEPALYIGCLGSGNVVMKSGEDRDRISAEHGIIAFEMEGAGAWDEIPCIVVKGICGYSDSHKNKAWQDYAAATAAATGRALLERYMLEDGDAAVVTSRKKLSREADAASTTEAGSQSAIVKFGKQNSGFQAGSITGSVSGLSFDGQTPLSWAMQNSEWGIDQLLLSTGGMNLSAQYVDGRKLPSPAIQNEQHQAAELLLSQEDTNSNVQDGDGEMSISSACGSGDERTSELKQETTVHKTSTSCSPQHNSFESGVESSTILARDSPPGKLFEMFKNILCSIGLIESSIPLGYQRVRWQNHCGKMIYDDYLEHELGSLQDLRNYLNSAAYQFGVNTGRVQRHISSPSTSHSPSTSNVVKPSGDQRGQEIPATKQRVSRFHEDLEMTKLSTNTLHLLICMERGRHNVSFCPEVVTDIINDQQLFNTLRKSYSKQRGRLSSSLSLRTVSSIQFMKFAYGGHRYVDVRCHDDICEQGKRCNCLPPVNLVRPNGSEYECCPVPSKYSPPIGPRLMMNFFTSPDKINPDSVRVLQQLPKRTQGGLSTQNTELIEAWGIYYKEGWDLTKIFLLLGVGFLLASLLFGILWTILKHDAQSAFGIAGWWLSGSTIVVGIIGTRAWDSLN